MAKPRTHRERAERAAEMSAVLDHKRRLRVQSVGAADIIARETFPTELVQAATELLSLSFENRPPRVELRIERRMKAVLDLYTKPEEGK